MPRTARPPTAGHRAPAPAAHPFARTCLPFEHAPGKLGRLYSLPGLPTTDLAATTAGLAFRTGLLVVPGRLRHGPHVKAAYARVGLD